jgi:AcrR family transcriptional regulator
VRSVLQLRPVGQAPRRAGRPRDQRLDEAIYRAALEVCLQRGYHATTYTEIARRAHVSTPAVYRRWPSKAAMAIDIYQREQDAELLPEAVSVRDYLVELMRRRIQTWSTPIFRQVVLPLLMDELLRGSAGHPIRTGTAESRKPLVTRIRGGITTGELRADTDPSRLLDILGGAISMPCLFGQDLPDESEAESIVDHVLTGFGPQRS